MRKRKIRMSFLFFTGLVEQLGLLPLLSTLSRTQAEFLLPAGLELGTSMLRYLLVLVMVVLMDWS